MAAPEFPIAGYINNASRTNAEQKQAFEDFLASTKRVVGGSREAGVIHTVTANTITPNNHVTLVDTSGGADNLDFINPANIHDGFIITLVANNPTANPITIRHNQSGLYKIQLKQEGPGYTAGSRDFVLNTANKELTLKYNANGQIWNETFFGRNPGYVSGRKLFTTSGSFVVPTGVTSVKVLMVGGGGGGGGSCGGSGGTNGTAGGDGGDTIFDTITAVGGGGAGGTSYHVNQRPGLGGKITTLPAGSAGGQHGMASIPGSSFRGEGGFGGAGFMGYGRGGKGGNAGDFNNASAGGGAGGQAKTVDAHAVTPGASLTVTIGAGGTAGSGGVGTPSGNDGNVGEAGAVLVEW